MAAALLRGRTGLCVKCIHRELCRLVWRPQIALFSSKPSDPRKQPRRTHIKKAKPQPAVDIPKLLEQLFSQRRPDTAPPAGKAFAAQAFAKPPPQHQAPPKPPATSSIKTFHSSSKPKPAAFASPAASTLKQADDVPTKATPPFKTAPASPPPDSVPVSPKSESPPVPKSSTGVSTKTSPSSETTSQTPPGFIGASSADGVSDTTTPTTATSVPPPTNPISVSIEPEITSIEPPAAETIEAKVETSVGSVELTAAPVPPSSADTVESNIETSEFTAATVEPLIETAIEPTVDALSSPLESVESRAASVESTVEPTIEAAVDTAAQAAQTDNTDSRADTFAHTALIENTAESTAMSVENKVESTVEACSLSSGMVCGKREEKEEERAVEEGMSVAEAMTLESVTLAEVKALVESLQTDVLLQTKSTLDDKAEKIVQDTLVQTGNAAERATAAETENLTVVLSERDSLSEDVEALEAETDILMEELFCSVPEAVSRTPAGLEPSSTFHSTASGPPMGASGELVVLRVKEEEATEAEAMTLESITLSEVKARVGTLETDVLQEAKTALEEEAEMLAKEQKMGEKTATEDAAVSEETTEAEILTLESLSEATDALEAETSVVLEAMFCSGPGPTDSFLVGQEPGSQFGHTEAVREKAIGQEAVRESAIGGEEGREEEGSVLEAMTLESVTLAEVKALVESLQTDVLLQTKSTLDDKAEKIIQDTLVQTGNAAEHATAAETENLTLVLSERDSLSEDVEALEAETDILMEELFCSVPEAVSRTPAGVEPSSTFHSTASGPPMGASGELVVLRVKEEEATEAEAMTLESITLSEVKARVGTLETDVLQEAKTALEEEAEMLAKEQKMGEKTATEDAAVSEETTEAEILTLESLSEATDALEAETSVVLEAMFCSGPGPTDSFLVGQEPGSQFGHTEAVREKATGQEAVRESAIGGEEGREEEGSVLEAMSLEWVTLAEVEAVVGTLESAALTETTAQLEKEAETLAKDEKMETKEEERKEEKTEAEVESLSLPEADGLSEALQAETDVLMEELLFSVPGRVAVVTEDPIGQEVVREDVLDGNVASETPVGVGEETLERGKGQEEIIVNEALTLESLTLSEIEALVETLEMDELTETETDQLETEAETPADETQMEQEAFSEVAEADVLSEAEILTKAKVLVEAADALEAESAVFLHNLLCPVPGLVTTTTVATGSAAVDSATTDALSPPAAPLTEVLGREEEEEEGAGSPPAGTREEVETEEGEQTEALGIHEGLDPVQRLFLEKIREYNNKQRLCGGTVEAGPDFEKRLSEEKAKLQRLYGGGDLSSFPQFTFTEPKLDQDPK